MQDFRKLDVWARSYKLILAVYAESNKLPDDERFGLISHMRRAAAGCKRMLASLMVKLRSRQNHRQTERPTDLT